MLAKKKNLFNKIACTWDISGECNYRCPYCLNAEDWERLKRETLIRSVEGWKDFWYNLYEKYGEIEIIISGAEPFAYPNFIEIVKEITKFHTCIISTNLSIGIEKFVKTCNPQRVRIHPAFHPSFADLGTFLGNLKLCRRTGFWPFIVVYVAYPPQIDDFKKYNKIFRDDGFVLKMRIFKTRNDWETRPFSQTEMRNQNFVKPEDKYSFRYLAGKISTQGYPCKTGIKYFRINHKGDILRCAQGTILGSVLEEEFSLNDSPSLCPYQKCPCEYEFSYCHYPTKFVPVELMHFKPIYLFNPRYLFYRLKTVDSFTDFKMRFCNLSILIEKILAGKYRYPLK